MNTERLFTIIVTELSTDLLKQEVELERLINSAVDINTKISDIKTCLEKISIIEMSLHKFNNMININNDNIPKQKKDGEI
jgi:hypothetical protein